MKTHFNSVCLGLLVVSLTLSGCGGGDEVAGGDDKSKGASGGAAAYDSPEQVFDAFKAAAANNDLKQFMGCMSAKSQNEFAFGMVMMSAFLPMQHMDDEAKAEALGKEIESVMAKHGLSEEKMDQMEPNTEPDYDKVFAPVKDKAAFVGDLFAIIEREDPDTPLKMLATASLKDVKVDGEKASGKMVVDGDEEDIEFVKVDGSWLIEMPGPGGPGPQN